MRTHSTAYLIRWALLLSSLCLLPLLLIHAQPADSDGLQAAFHAQADCSSPCFMGIQPGQTRYQEMIDRLRQDAWVLQSSLVDLSSTDNVLAWQWSEAAPEWIDRQTRGAIGLSQGRVQTLALGTSLSWGDVVLALGRPDAVRRLDGESFFSTLAAYGSTDQGWYSQWGLLVVSSERCWPSKLYGWAVRFQFRAVPPDLSPVSRPAMAHCE